MYCLIVHILVSRITYVVSSINSSEEAKQKAEEIGTKGYFGCNPDGELMYIPAHRIEKIIIKEVGEE